MKDAKVFRVDRLRIRPHHHPATTETFDADGPAPCLQVDSVPGRIVYGKSALASPVETLLPTADQCQLWSLIKSASLYCVQIGASVSAMPFLSTRALRGLQQYQYKSGGYTIFDQWHQPFWNGGAACLYSANSILALGSDRKDAELTLRLTTVGLQASPTCCLRGLPQTSSPSWASQA